MVSVTRGQISDENITEKLVSFLEQKNTINGTLFLGYPVLPTIENKLAVDALLVSPQYGIIAFSFYNGVRAIDFEEIQDELYRALLSKIAKEKNLVKRSTPKIQLEVVSFAPNLSDDLTPSDSFKFFKDIESFHDFLSTLNKNNDQYYEYALSCIQSVVTMKKILERNKVKNPDSKGGKLKKLENMVATLDNVQTTAALELSENVQRIRGLAGSGKTVVLALKAAYLHVSNPNLEIAVTFSTRSLKQQFKELIERFVYEQSESFPDWNRVHIVHAWGSPREEGVYYNFCKIHETEYLDFKSASTMSSYEDAFSYACTKALNDVSTYKKMFDIILVDEAQDFSKEFLQLCYFILPSKKRLVYAYDELQSLTKNTMETVENIFGSDSNGNPRVSLKNRQGCAREDIILDTCYRNSRPILVTAHALGFRIYGDLIQMFDESELWEDIGYEVISGNLNDNSQVTLGRKSASSPEFLESHSTIEDLVKFMVVDDERKQAKAIAQSIQKNLTEDELEFKDIIVIHTNPYTTKQRVGLVRNELLSLGINSHLAGVSTSPDDFYADNSITFTSIFRAKGNEAAMVYVFDAQICGHEKVTAKSRNILFTAITRSKAWVRVIGYGEGMQNLANEYAKILTSNFTLNFVYPDKNRRDTLSIIHRDKSQYETTKIQNNINLLSDLANDIKNKRFFYRIFQMMCVVKSRSFWMNDIKLVKKEINSIIQHLIKIGISVEQNYPIIRGYNGEERLEWSSVQNLSISMKNLEYDAIYDELNKNKDFSLKLIDGCLIQFLYTFKGKKLTSHRIAMFPSPNLPPYSDNPDIYDNDMIYGDITSKNIVPFPIRFDFSAEEIQSKYPHPFSHVTLGQFTNCRIPAYGPISPIIFINFILENFYDVENDALLAPNFQKNLRTQIKTIRDDERKKLHFNFENL